MPIPQPLTIGEDFAVVPIAVMPILTDRIRTMADRVQTLSLQPPTHLVEQLNLSPSDRADLDNNFFG